MIDVQQVRQEYQEGFDLLVTRKERWVQQLVLTNNMQRPEETIASTMLFSVFTRTFSNLYDNRLQTKFSAMGDSDFKKVQSINLLQQNDYQEMDKAALDYEWTWDACFFGRGYCETLNFDKKRKILVPSAINPLMLIYDPFFPNPKQWRYYGKWVLKSRPELLKIQEAGEFERGVTVDALPGGVEPMLWSYDIRRKAAKVGNANSNETTSPVSIYQVYEHFTHDPQTGKKWIVWTDRDLSKIIRRKELDLRDGDDGKSSNWPLAVKQVFKEPHSSMPTSIPDIIEDKHRALNVLYNLMYVAAKDETNPIYVYNEKAVKDLAQLFQRQVNQHIPIKDGYPLENAIAPLRKSPTVTNSISQFIALLKTESAEAVGTSQISAPLKTDKTATQAAIQQQIADLTGALQAKVLAEGDREFWEQWYQRYLHPDNMAAGDKKIIQIANVDGVTFESITVEGIKTSLPPRLEIKSEKEAEVKAMVSRKDMMTVLPLLSKTIDPKGMRLFMKDVFLPKFDLPVTTLDGLYPKSVEEIRAEQENGQIQRNELPLILETDDDLEHYYVHLQARNTPAKWAHIFAHEDQLARKKAAAAANAQTGPPADLPGGPQADDMPPEEVPGMSEGTIEGGAAPGVSAMRRGFPNKSTKPSRP